MDALKLGIESFRKQKPDFRLLACEEYSEIFILGIYNKRMYDLVEEDPLEIATTSFVIDKKTGDIKITNTFIDLSIMKIIDEEESKEIDITNYMTDEEINFQEKYMEALSNVSK